MMDYGLAIISVETKAGYDTDTIVSGKCIIIAVTAMTSGKGFGRANSFVCVAF